MKIKALCCCLLASLTVLLSGCAGCFQKISYPFQYDESEISKISIVLTLDGYNYDSYKYEVKVEIDDIDTFLTTFNKVLFGRYLFNEPSSVGPNRYAILVEYINGDIEFIHCYSQDIIVGGESHYGVVYCDEDEFDNFINSYLTDNK